jgi:hypothetical protein
MQWEGEDTQKKKSEWDPTFTKLYEMPSHSPHKSSYGIALC